jgi:hypothetical protein
MKFHYYLIATLLFFTACGETTDEPIPANKSLIEGKWKQAQAFISSGEPQYWVDVENEEEINFM